VRAVVLRVAAVRATCVLIVASDPSGTVPVLASMTRPDLVV
jgi:hypothetical protein